MVKYVIYDGKQANVHGLTTQNLVVKRSNTPNEFITQRVRTHIHTHTRILTRNLDYYVFQREHEKRRWETQTIAKCVCVCVAVDGRKGW